MRQSQLAVLFGSWTGCRCLRCLYSSLSGRANDGVPPPCSSFSLRKQRHLWKRTAGELLGVLNSQLAGPDCAEEGRAVAVLSGRGEGGGGPCCARCQGESNDGFELEGGGQAGRLPAAKSSAAMEWCWDGGPGVGLRRCSTDLADLERIWISLDDRSAGLCAVGLERLASSCNLADPERI